MKPGPRTWIALCALLIAAWGCGNDNAVQSDRDTQACDVTPRPLAFGAVELGDSADRSFTIKNNGTVAIADTVSSACADFVVVSGDGPYSLMPGESRVVTVRFTPTAVGLSNCAIETGTPCGSVDCAGQAVPRSVTIPADRDNTLYEDPLGSLSNGAGGYMFVGRTNQTSNDKRRALLRFPVADSVPAGAQIDSVVLELTMTRSIVQLGPQIVSIHTVEADWGEAGSNASGAGGGQGSGDGAPADSGDATWLHTFYDTATWNTPGGDFSATASATVTIDGVGAYRWGSTPEMASDVQGWLDDDATNFGWLVREQENLVRTAMRFNTRENTEVDTRPRLVVYYTQ